MSGAQIKRLFQEVAAVSKVCGPGAGARFGLASLTSIFAILQEKTLHPADRKMGAVSVSYRGAQIEFPTDRLDAQNSVENDSPAFGTVREIFARDVYLRGFKSLPPIGSMLDLGANRGVVSVLGAKGLGAKWVCGVEPVESYEQVFNALADENHLGPEQRHRIVGFIGSAGTKDVHCVDQILNSHDIQQLDFLKCDIEGGENDVFLDPAATFLNITQRLVVELHPDMGALSREIADRIIESGFSIHCTDPGGNPCDIEAAEYLYASQHPAELQTSGHQAPSHIS